MEQGKPEARIAYRELMQVIAPQGRPDHIASRYYKTKEMILEEHGLSAVVKSIHLMIKDFCSAFNVVRNMTEEQMIDCAFALAEFEPESFIKLEDFAMMFDGAKKGKYGTIYDRIDMQTIIQMLNKYLDERWIAGEKYRDEEFTRVDRALAGCGERSRPNELDSKMMKFAGGFSAANRLQKDLGDENNG